MLKEAWRENAHLAGEGWTVLEHLDKIITDQNLGKQHPAEGLTVKSRGEWKEKCLMAVSELKNDDETEKEEVYWVIA